MIRALTEYARRNQLVVEPGFSAKSVRWLASIDQDGMIMSVVSANPIRLRQSRFATCPDLQQGQLKSLPATLRKQGYVVHNAAHFLADSFQTVTLYSPDKVISQKTLYKHETFKLLIALAATEVQALQPLQLALEDRDGQLEALRGMLLSHAQLRPNDLLSFVIDGEPILESDVWHDWWREFRRQFHDESDTRVALTHPKLTRLGTGALSFGAPLISFDKAAFESYGLRQGENCAMSAKTATAYRAALEHLLPNALKVAGSKVVYWYESNEPLKIDPFATLLGADHHESMLTLEEFRNQRSVIGVSQPDTVAEVRYHSMVMRGAKGRARVQLYCSGTLMNAIDAIALWLEQSAIVGVDGLTLELHPLPWLVEALERPAAKPDRKSSRETPDKKQKQKTPSTKSGALTMLLQTILDPRMNVSSGIVAQIITMIQSSVGNREFARALDEDARQSPARRALLAQLGLLKAWLIRSGDAELCEVLEPDHDQPSYQAGRLAAQLQRVRAIADKRYVSLTAHRDFARLIANPSELLERGSHSARRDLRHIALLRPWVAIFLEKRLEQVWQVLHGTIPAHCNTRDRALFILGYYQQIVFDNIKRDAARPRDDSLSASWDDEIEGMDEINQIIDNADINVFHSVK